ncbi:MAG: OTU domain-containing protein [Legionellaceae bacterium]
MFSDDEITAIFIQINELYQRHALEQSKETIRSLNETTLLDLLIYLSSEASREFQAIQYLWQDMEEELPLQDITCIRIKFFIILQPYHDPSVDLLPTENYFSHLNLEEKQTTCERLFKIYSILVRFKQAIHALPEPHDLNILDNHDVFTQQISRIAPDYRLKLLLSLTDRLPSILMHENSDPDAIRVLFSNLLALLNTEEQLMLILNLVEKLTYETVENHFGSLKTYLETMDETSKLKTITNNLHAQSPSGYFKIIEKNPNDYLISFFKLASYQKELLLVLSSRGTEKPTDYQSRLEATDFFLSILEGKAYCSSPRTFKSLEQHLDVAKNTVLDNIIQHPILSQLIDKFKVRRAMRAAQFFSISERQRRLSPPNVIGLQHLKIKQNDDAFFSAFNASRSLGRAPIAPLTFRLLIARHIQTHPEKWLERFENDAAKLNDYLERFKRYTPEKVSLRKDLGIQSEHIHIVATLLRKTIILLSENDLFTGLYSKEIIRPEFHEVDDPVFIYTDRQNNYGAMSIILGCTLETILQSLHITLDKTHSMAPNV